MVNNFSFSIPQEIIFGIGSLEKLPDLLIRNKAGKILLISDRGLEGLGAVKRVFDIVAGAGFACEAFLDVESNPSVETVNAATEMFKNLEADTIIALGGGSPMDVAKATGILATYGGDITAYEGVGKVPGKIVPIIAIPTTAGTGSEATPFAVITDRSRNYKLSIIGPGIIPAFALLDPSLITSLPPQIAASTGIDALVHAVESYLSKAATPFSDSMGEKAMELIGKHLRHFTADRSNVEAASGMLLASIFGGIAFSWARLGNVHAMAHPLGGFFNIPHGVANAVLLPTILEYNSIADNGRYEKIYNYIRKNKDEKINGFTPDILVSEVKKLLKDLGIPENLTALGVSTDKIHDMAVDAMKSGNVLVNPRQSTLKDIEDLYIKAM